MAVLRASAGGWVAITRRTTPGRTPSFPFLSFSKRTRLQVLRDVNHLDSIKSAGFKRSTVLHGSLASVWRRTSLLSEEVHSARFILSAAIKRSWFLRRRKFGMERINQIAAGCRFGFYDVFLF